MNRQEKLEKYKKMADKGLWEVDNDDVRAFYQRAKRKVSN
jgi:predicted metalloendopeptidase